MGPSRARPQSKVYRPPLTIAGRRRGGGGDGGVGGGVALVRRRRWAGKGRITGELLVMEEVPDSDGEGGVVSGGCDRRAAGVEIGSRVGTAEEAGRLIVGAGRFFRRLEGSQPHPDLLRRVFDLRHPSSRWPLSNPHEFASSSSAAAAFGLGFQLDGWSLGKRLLLILGVEFHEERVVNGLQVRKPVDGS
ncbi:hypothetical protein HPP92_016958 [Vanilla planifolia]|uniref:Uncharacterized protein n=1 Tax=Vanilla planifolia TaxID=51239 RepID=A0A835QP78_VANPL|nr:hypothetical protein HPP92_016958 [Vanilla planifolia]